MEGLRSPAAQGSLVLTPPLSPEDETLRTAGWRWLAATADGADVLVLLHGAEPDRATARRFAAMSPQAERTGFSAAFTGLDRLPEALKEARMAASVAPAGRGIAYYDDFGSFGNVAAALSPKQLTEYVTTTLGALRAYDLKRGSSLLETLRRFVANSGQVAETAAELSIHVNTLHQRIQRIEQVTGLDLRSYRDIARITLALDMLQITGDPPFG
ncbi:PucR family transcriptional regulator [Actinocorallia herbida]|nr:helix-turn-helix domain-containing protein [Actinocorallia herbida]